METFTYRFASAVNGLTEIQAGSYLLMDTAFGDHGVREFDCALSVLTTVICRPTYPGADSMVIVDAGRNIYQPNASPPRSQGAGWRQRAGSQRHEHTRIRFGDAVDVPRWVTRSRSRLAM